jgi:hypothetical protein
MIAETQGRRLLALSKVRVKLHLTAQRDTCADLFGSVSRIVSASVKMSPARVTSQVCRFEVLGDGHAMLRRAPDWSELTTRFLTAELRLRTPAPLIEDAMRQPVPRDSGYRYQR